MRTQANPGRSHVRVGEVEDDEGACQLQILAATGVSTNPAGMDSGAGGDEPDEWKYSGAAAGKSEGRPARPLWVGFSNPGLPSPPLVLSKCQCPYVS